MKLTLCTSYKGGVRERSNTTSRYQHDNVTLWASNRRNTAKARRHAAKARRHESSRISQQRLVTHNTLASRRSEILEWVSAIPYTEHHKRISKGRLEGTVEWLFKKEEYCAWRSSSVSKLLLLRGIRKFFACLLHRAEFSSYQLVQLGPAKRTLHQESSIISS